MEKTELRASLALAGIFALRMLGLFLILPVFSMHAKGLPGGDQALLVGLALGVYGLVQACLHIPLGMLSDKYGRRPVVVAGLLLFVLGAVIAGSHDDLMWIIVGRAIQGSWCCFSSSDRMVGRFNQRRNSHKSDGHGWRQYRPDICHILGFGFSFA